ncbi:hypothetical protein BRO54_0311 [Geobacillus proteiniphilus]|uniref:Uncharacterized protein n=1 Tax=Geobacillus proteiniphilus TaxID=860353 RepID=A0A1Q5T988_9BACL|nr:hypothetical protein BRO54_0311 [Geobacillus proteiniphilus]
MKNAGASMKPRFFCEKGNGNGTAFLSKISKNHPTFIE